MEEPGAEPVDCKVTGRFDCSSSADRPYRPHIPHPAIVRLVVTDEVRLAGRPTNPAGAEQVERVELADADEASRWFRSIGRPELGELYPLADRLRGSAPSNTESGARRLP